MSDQKFRPELNERFNRAYKRIPFRMRELARNKFCEVHSVTYGSFKHKLSGGNAVTEMECEWMEKHDPYEQPVTA